jgi:hypothetical protein
VVLTVGAAQISLGRGQPSPTPPASLLLPNNDKTPAVMDHDSGCFYS